MRSIRAWCLVVAVGALNAVIAADAPAMMDISAELEKIRAAHKLPALAAAVIVDGKLVAVNAVGVRKIGDPTPVTVNDQFHLGSCTKAITGTLAQLLVADKKIRWDSTLADVFPELAEGMLPVFRGVTLEQLVAHRSGLAADTSSSSDMFKLEVANNKLPGKLSDKRVKFLKAVLQEEPSGKPGGKYEYANCNFVLAAAMLERVSGRSWEELVAEKIFQPLGMKSAGFGAMGQPGKVSQPWQHEKTLFGAVPVEPGPNSDNPALMTPAGRVHCSIADWARYVAAHVLNVEKSPAQLAFVAPASGQGYVAGWNVTRRNWAKGVVLHHNGTNTMNYAVVWASPADRFAVLVSTNQGGDAAAKACDEVCTEAINELLTKK